MAIPLYLAKTAAEFEITEQQPDHLAWMACHFSPYGTGLTNLPSTLPENAMLILNDRMPVQAHDPIRVKETVKEIATKQNCCGILLDFQRPGAPEIPAIIRELLSLPFPVCVSEPYAKDFSCPVFLPPVPLTSTVEEHLSAWEGREIWLEAAMEHAVFSVTKSASSVSYQCDETDCTFIDRQLCCHYRIELQEDRINFFLTRNTDDMDLLLEKANALGVTKAVGLWQEFRQP